MEIETEKIPPPTLTLTLKPTLYQHKRDCQRDCLTTPLTDGVGDNRSNLPTSPATDDAPPPPAAERPAKSWLGFTADNAEEDGDAAEVDFGGDDSDIAADAAVAVGPAKS